LLIDLDQGVFYRAPLGAVDRRALRASGWLGDGSLNPATRGGSAFVGFGGQRGQSSGQDVVALRRAELEQHSAGSLRIQRSYDSLAFSHEDADSDIVESRIPGGTRIIQIWRSGGHVETMGRVSLVFGPRGFIQPTAIWLENADQPGKGRHTVYFSGIAPPMVRAGIFLPDGDGALTPVELR
jgi:hypothetical protein